MILVTPQIKQKYPKAFSAARKERFRVVWLRDDLIYCARKAKGHGDYLVRVFAVPSVNGGHQVKLQCKSINGEACDGVYWGKGCCAHIAAVLLRTEKKSDKKSVRKVA